MADLQFVVEADARRTKVIDVSLPISQADVTGTGGRIAYKPARVPTGAAWFGEHGVGLELLRAIWSLQWDDGVRNNSQNAPFNSIGAARDLGQSPGTGGFIASITHSFRLLRSSQAAASYSQVAPALDLPAFCVFRTKHIINTYSLPGTTPCFADNISTVVEGQEWDFTDGQGHGMVVTNPEIMITGMTVIMNQLSGRYKTDTGMVGLATCKLVCRPVVVDLDTYHKCFQ